MMRLYVSYLKEMSARWPLLALLVACQAVLGYAGSFALSERPPELRAAVFSGDSGEAAGRLVEALKSTPGLEVVEAASADEAESLALGHEALGAVVIEDGFDERLSTAGSGSGAVRFVATPGENSGLAVREYVLAALVRLRAEARYNAEMLRLGAPPRDLEARTEAVLSVKYSGPPFVDADFRATQAYGVPSLFMLLVAFFCATTFPGPDDRRMALRGRRAMLRGYAAAMAAALTVCGILLAVYFAFGAAMYGSLPGAAAAAAFAALCVYCAAAGGLVAALGARGHSAWIFLPWVFANMTLGGGLWGLVAAPAFARPLLPVACLLGAVSGDTSGMAALAAAGAALAVCGVAALALRAGQNPA